MALLCCLSLVYLSFIPRPCLCADSELKNKKIGIKIQIHLYMSIFFCNFEGTGRFASTSKLQSHLGLANITASLRKNFSLRTRGVAAYRLRQESYSSEQAQFAGSLSQSIC